MLKRAIKYLLIAFLFVSCSSQETEKYFSFPDNTWKRFENPLINLEITKPGIFYNLYVVIEYDKATAPDFVPITVITSTPGGEVRSVNAKPLLNEDDGRVKLIIRKDFAFSEAGNCSFEIENRSQDLETKGLIRIGVVLEKID
jgi:hypothetical protein